MSSDRPSGVPSPPPEADDAEPSLAAVVAEHGLPLLDALEQHLPGARRHADGTAAYALATAAELGFERDRAESIREAARVHDVGLVYVPAAVLARPAGALSDEERSMLDSHLEAAYRLCRGSGIPDEVCGWILRTRERYDGRGPERLSGMDVPIEARITRTACAADLLLAGAGGEGTVDALRAAEGRELDPVVTDAVVAVVERATAT
jgi:HD-GYP domain-containing protein (c-di-GMP phosphodiesterase class II)